MLGHVLFVLDIEAKWLQHKRLLLWRFYLGMLHLLRRPWVAWAWACVLYFWTFTIDAVCLSKNSVFCCKTARTAWPNSPLSCCSWSILVAYVFRSLALIVSQFWGSCSSSGRSTCQLCSEVFVFSQFYNVHCGWSIHLSSVLNSYFGSHPPC